MERGNTLGKGKKDKQENGNRQKGKKKIALILGAILLIILAFILYNKPAVNSDIKSGSISIDVRDGIDDSLQEELNNRVEEGMFMVFINTNIKMDTGKSKANLLIENNELNHNSCIVRLETLDGLKLYTSDEIPVGYKIEEASLLEELEQGKYDCIAHFDILGDNGKINSTINVSVKLTVIN